MARKRFSGKQWIVIAYGIIQDAIFGDNEGMPSVLVSCPICGQTKVIFFVQEGTEDIYNEQRCDVCKSRSKVGVNYRFFEVDDADR